MDINYRLKLHAILFLLGCYLVLNTGFMLVRFPPAGPGVPIGMLVVVLYALLFLASTTPIKHVPRATPITALAIWWGYGFVHLVLGYVAYGFWAIRDAAHMLESSYLLIGYSLAIDHQFKPIFQKWLRTVAVVIIVYTILYPFSGYLGSISPKIQSMSGYTAPLVFNYVNISSTALTAVCSILSGRNNATLVIACGIAVTVLIVFVQARIVYLQLALLLFLLVTFSPLVLRRLGLVAACAFLIASLFIASGVQLPGRLGQAFTVDFLINHLAAIWGGGRRNC